MEARDTHAMVIRVDVRAQDVHGFITRIPRRGERVPHPDQVVKAVMFSQAVVEDIIQLLARLRSLCTPPEPSAFGLVKGTEDDRDVRILESQQLFGNGVNVSDDQGVIGVGGVS